MYNKRADRMAEDARAILAVEQNGENCKVDKVDQEVSIEYFNTVRL